MKKIEEIWSILALFLRKLALFGQIQALLGPFHAHLGTYTGANGQFNRRLGAILGPKAGQMGT